MRTLCEMCLEAEGSIRLKGKLGMMVCPACKKEVDDRLLAERGMAAERARLFLLHPDVELEMPEGDSE